MARVIPKQFVCTQDTYCQEHKYRVVNVVSEEKRLGHSTTRLMKKTLLEPCTCDIASLVQPRSILGTY